MSRDALEYAKQRLIDDDWARSCGVEPPPFPREVIAGLVAEVERLRKVEKDANRRLCDD